MHRSAAIDAHRVFICTVKRRLNKPLTAVVMIMRDKKAQKGNKNSSNHMNMGPTKT